MGYRFRSLTAFTFAVALSIAASGMAAAQTPLTLQSARITIAGTTNVHDYTASTTAVRLTDARLAQSGAAASWEELLKPGGLELLKIAIAAGTLTSPKHDLDDNMHKALKVREYADITFLLRGLEPQADGGLKAVGTLSIAGVDKDIAFDVVARHVDAALGITGHVKVVMTEYGITPPKAMLGMLKTNPAVTITFDAVFAKTPLQ